MPVSKFFGTPEDETPVLDLPTQQNLCLFPVYSALFWFSLWFVNRPQCRRYRNDTSISLYTSNEPIQSYLSSVSCLLSWLFCVIDGAAFNSVRVSVLQSPVRSRSMLYVVMATNSWLANTISRSILSWCCAQRNVVTSLSAYWMIGCNLTFKLWPRFYPISCQYKAETQPTHYMWIVPLRLAYY